jgi:hypothetical protein
MYAVLKKTSPLYCSHLMTFSLMGWPALFGGQFVAAGMAGFIVVWISSSVVFTELHENNAFLRMMPLTDREIVQTKFSLAFVAVLVYWLILAFFVFTAAPVGAEKWMLALATLGAGVALPAAAVWYIFIWLVGRKVAIIVFANMMGLTLFTIIILSATHPEFREFFWANVDELQIASRLESGGILLHLTTAFVAVLAYYGMMQVAVRVKERSEKT